MKHQCEGTCAIYHECEGEVRLVRVSRPDTNEKWEFYYCEEAIREDQRRGFIVKVLKDRKENRNED